MKIKQPRPLGRLAQVNKRNRLDRRRFGQLKTQGRDGENFLLPEEW